MYQFDFHKVTSGADAAVKLAANGEAKLLAGGQTLLASMKLRLARPSDLIDLSAAADLRGIKVDGTSVTIGAMTRHAEVAASAEVKKAIPALAALAGGIGDRMVRNMGTLGGSVANNDPAADYPAAVLGLNATALESGEVITSISFPIPKRAAYIKFKNPASRYALVGVFVADTGAGVRVAVTGAAPSVFRVTEMEKALSAKFTVDAVAGIKVPADGLNADLHAQADYRAHLITVMAKRAVEQALK